MITSANLKKAYKLTFKDLYPGENKQNTSLVLAVFHPTTSAAIESYFENCKDFSDLLKLTNVWWTISNSKQRYKRNYYNGNVALTDDTKPLLEKLIGNRKYEFCKTLITAQRVVLNTYSHQDQLSTDGLVQQATDLYWTSCFEFICNFGWYPRCYLELSFTRKWCCWSTLNGKRIIILAPFDAKIMKAYDQK